jgi:transcriptional regulator GlxA family with amidase domain
MKQCLLFLFVSLAAFSSFGQTAAAEVYVCPPCNGGCDNETYTKDGTCPHCAMPLIKKSQMNQKPMTVCFYLQDGVEVLDFAGPMEVFSYAGAKIFTVSKTKAPIKSQGILNITPDYDITDAPAFDILAVFGGNAGNAYNDPQVISWIKSKKATTKYYFSVCTGAFIFARAGLLDNLTVTTFHSSIEGLRKEVPTAKVLDNVRFVDNGTIITTAGISAGIDGALHMVEKLGGKDLARKVAFYMEYDKWVPENGLIIAK